MAKKDKDKILGQQALSKIKFIFINPNSELLNNEYKNG